MPAMARLTIARTLTVDICFYLYQLHVIWRYLQIDLQFENNLVGLQILF